MFIGRTSVPRIIASVASLSLTFLSITACGSSRPKEATTDKDYRAPILEEIEGDAQSLDRYNLKTPDQKLVTNQGEGYENLYGTRNLRPILANTVYRGGANNKYNRYSTRSNQNPLPTIGLDNLCKEGFEHAVYLYSNNFSTAPKKVHCVNRRTGKANSLEYLQIGPYNEKSVREILSIIHQKVKNPGAGAAYVHCWNGWHASGLISAYTLRQFCGVSGADAVKYWDRNTDGNNTDPAFASIRNNIRRFVPHSDFNLTTAERNRVCLPLAR